MKQLLQSLKDGSTELVEVPAPKVGAGSNLIQTNCTLVSAGTERMLVEFGKSNLLKKARSQPDKVRMVVDKAKTDGLAATLETVKSKLDQPLALGYCNVGTVIEVNCSGFSVGDRVVSNGKHAEIVSVPKNLCAKIPDNVSDEEAAFTIIGAIGLQGIRLVKPSLGEKIVVTGLGLIGLLTVQMLCAQGCRVLGVDFDHDRLALARSFGAETVNLGLGEDLLLKADQFSKGNGVDAVLITASSPSNVPISQAAKMCRKRGRIVLVGVVGLDLSRADFYEKELTFQVSCSYGPGRYDANYENKGNDYPIGFVRWTEQRNFEAVLEMMSTGALNVKPLISHRFALLHSQRAMDLLTSNEPSLGILLSYPMSDSSTKLNRKISIKSSAVTQYTLGQGVVAFVGAGNYAGRVLMPAFKAAGSHLHTVVSNGGVSSVHFGKKFKFDYAATDFDAVLSDDSIDTVVIATRHDTHASLVIDALEAGKHVFCEKPLCLTLNELSKIEKTVEKHAHLHLMLGFNRRFSPHVRRMKDLLDTLSEPKTIIITVNAGDVPGDHWAHDESIGGGRLVGEGCHFVDLARHLAGSSVSSYQVSSITQKNAKVMSDDICTINLSFENGSIASVHYFANGHKAYPKERIEVFTGGRVLQLDNFRKLRGWGWSDFTSHRLWKQDKGQLACAEAFLNAVKGTAPTAISKDEIFEVSKITINAAAMVRTS